MNIQYIKVKSKEERMYRKGGTFNQGKRFSQQISTPRVLREDAIVS